MSGEAVARDALFATLPPPWPASLAGEIAGLLAARRERLVVLDDDPTGTQTVHDLPVLTEWSVASLRAELERSPVFYLLTNSRSLTPAAAAALAREVGGNLRRAAEETGWGVAVTSRSDSTLRGHFPGEVDALGEALGGGFRGTLLAPYFAEGGRFTVGDVHYVLQGELLVPAARTEFARDRVFGYTHSHLPAWVEEKTGGRVPAAQVVSVTLDDLRRGGPAAVAARLESLEPGGAVIVNAAADRDLEVLVAGLLRAEAAGLRLLYRTAASFVRVRGGIAPRALLTSAETRAPDGAAGGSGGLVVVGSYVARSSEQLRLALQVTGVHPVELDVARLIAGEGEGEGWLAGKAAAEQARAGREVNRLLADGEDVVLFTSRAHQAGSSEAETLAIGQRVSRALCAVVAGLARSPRYLIAKGGITSSDVATVALGVKRAWVLGQLQPGVPVWRLGPESRFPGMSYVVYPGNVGQPDSVAQAIRFFRE
jgi:uncharacterized protein YgbK (DUF1537 family)